MYVIFFVIEMEVLHIKEDKIHLINKIFNNETIRTVWDSEEEKYYISVIDIVGVLTESDSPRKYWNKLKQRLKVEGNETVTNCHQLKLKAMDGKYRLTDVVDIEGMFRIIQSIPSKHAEPIKLWLAKLGKERIDETLDPSLAVQRAIDIYRSKGYTEDWIIRRIKGIQDRKKLLDTWESSGINDEVEFAILTNEIYKEWSGMTAKEYKQFKNIHKESLRDNMSDIEYALTDLSEIATREFTKKHKPYGLKENKEVAIMGGHVAKVARDDIEKNLGKSIVTKQSKLNYEYLEDKELIQ